MGTRCRTNRLPLFTKATATSPNRAGEATIGEIFRSTFSEQMPILASPAGRRLACWGFPASDIPRQARELYARKLTKILEQIAAVGDLPETHSGANKPSWLRGIHRARHLL
jgi:hypothetical protein